MSRSRSTMSGFKLVLDSISELSGLDVCVHDIVGFTRSGKTRLLPQRLGLHTHPYCRSVKRRDSKQCVAEDSVKTNARARKLSRPFIKKCHAGVSELVVPVFIGGLHSGTIFLGPFLADDDAPPSLSSPSATARGNLPRRPGSEIRKLGKFVSVMAGFAAQAGEALMLREQESRARSEPVRRALRFAAEHYGSPVTVAEVAAKAYLSASRFAHLFSEEMGIPFHQYLNSLRINRARNLLTHTSLKILDVAAQCGFCNQNYFASVFKKAVGDSPRNFRRKQQDSIDI